MNVDFAILADAAQVAQGKLYLLGGGWTEYKVQTIPAQIRAGIGLGFVGDAADHNKNHTVRLSIVDPQDRPVIPQMEMEIEVGEMKEDRDLVRVVVGLMLNLQVAFTGKFRLLVSIGKESAKEVPFFVVLVNAPLQH